MFRYDHQERLTAVEAMSHPYFKPVLEAAAKGFIHPIFFHILFSKMY